MGLVERTSHVMVKGRKEETTYRESVNLEGRAVTEDRASWKKRKLRRSSRRAAGDSGRKRLKGEGFQSLPGSGKEDAGNELPADHHEWLRSQVDS